MRTFFKRTFVEIDCLPLDDSKPVVAELTSKGELILHNYDEESEIIAAEMGFGVGCLTLGEEWENFIKRLFGPGEANEDIIPKSFMIQAERVSKKIRETAQGAFELSGYREPSSKWVDRAGVAFRLFIDSIYPENVSVIGTPVKVFHSSYRKRNYPGTLLRLNLTTSLVGYIQLLNKIPDGVIYDPKSDTFCIAAGIDRVISKDKLVVFAGKQGRGVSVDNRTAIAEKVIRHSSDGLPITVWVVSRWM